MTDNSDLTQDFNESLSQFGNLEDGAEMIRQSFGTITNTKQDARSIKKLLELVAQVEKLTKEGGVNKWFEAPISIDVLPKHAAFFRAGAKYPERLFMAANRVGKSISGAYELTCHLTGIYPDWWEGRRFDGPIKAWAVGKDARAVRDTAQKELIGPIGEWGTGMLPAHTLGKFFALQGTPQAIDIIKVRHKSGGWSELGFKNYQQDIGSFMGTSREVIWLDEECPLEIYNECNIRCATVDGIMMVTFTPLDGLTNMVVNFCKKADFIDSVRPMVAIDDDGGEQTVGRSTAKAVISATWDDVPWLTPEMQERLLEDTPVHLRDSRSKGLPSVGSGNVYPIPLDRIVCEPFAIPDSWPRMYALDVGWNKTAATWGALDPATDTIYLFDEHYVGQEHPSYHAYAIQSRGKWVQGVIDPAARGRSQIDGMKLIQSYKDLGLDLRPAKNEVESGILNVSQRLVAGKLKVFKTLVNGQKEYQLYRRDKHGKVVKEDDHAMDTWRYICNNLDRMSSKSQHSDFKHIKYRPTGYDI